VQLVKAPPQLKTDGTDKKKEGADDKGGKTYTEEELQLKIDSAMKEQMARAEVISIAGKFLAPADLLLVAKTSTKDLCLKALQVLQPRIAADSADLEEGTLVQMLKVADNMAFVEPKKNYAGAKAPVNQTKTDSLDGEGNRQEEEPTQLTVMKASLLKQQQNIGNHTVA
jgi:hypothetical protein